jgi:hypothetical protein
MRSVQRYRHYVITDIRCLFSWFYNIKRGRVCWFSLRHIRRRAPMIDAADIGFSRRQTLLPVLFIISRAFTPRCLILMFSFRFLHYHSVRLMPPTE